jgi:hypothetical protein
MVAFSLALKINFTSKIYLATNKRARSYIYNNKSRFNDHVFQNGFSRCVRTSGTYETSCVWALLTVQYSVWTDGTGTIYIQNEFGMSFAKVSKASLHKGAEQLDQNDGYNK